MNDEKGTVGGSETACMACDGRTKRVAAETVAALVPRRKADQNEGFRFCPAAYCDVVYSRKADGVRVNTDELDVEVFQKSDNAERLVCYCFGHTVAAVEAGASDIVEDIKTKCSQGLDQCEIMNPQGRCCLGNVNQIAIRRADKARHETIEAAAAEVMSKGCCATEARLGPRAAAACAAEALPLAKVAPTKPAPRTGWWATGGAMTAAVLSSACCWLPLSLIALGVSVGGIGAFFEAYRGVLLAVTGVLLVVGFYFVYLRKPACAPGDACAVPNRRLQRLNKVMLWMATVFVAGFALFPNYIGFLLGAGEAPVAEAASVVGAATPSPTDAVTTTTAIGGVTRRYAVVGMSCEGCTVAIKEAVEKLPMVSSATIVFEEKVARVTFAAGAGVDDAAVLAAIDDTGFEASVKHR